jgi:hypothetical protein
MCCVDCGKVISKERGRWRELVLDAVEGGTQ